MAVGGAHRRRKPRAQAQAKTAVDKRQDAKIDKLYRLHEMKHIDVVQGVTSLSTTPQIVLLNGTTADDTDTGRGGNKIMMNSFTFKFSLVNADTVQLYRVIILYDRQTNGALPAANDVLQTAGEPLSQLTWVNRKRFKILFDNVYYTNTQELSQSETSHFKFKQNAQRVMYSSGVNTIAAIISGSLILVALSDSGATSHPTLEFTTRCNFNDL